MTEFLQAVRQYEFMRYALLAGLLCSVVCGVVGTYVVTRRISYIAGGISHCILGGIGAAIYLNKVCGIKAATPLAGAVIAALLSAVIIGLVALRARQREDAIIGAMWAVGMASGIIFISITPGYSQDLMSYLFGNILMVSSTDLWVIAALDVFVVAACVIFYRPFMAICFDEEFARARGLNVEFLFLLLLIMTALTTVVLVSAVGVVLVIALLTLPASIATMFSRALWKIMLLAGLLCVAFTTGGIALSYGPDLPAGATIIILSAATYILMFFVKKMTTRKAARQ